MPVSKTGGLCSNRSRPANIIELWCNGNTTDSGPVIPGSNPGNSAKNITFLLNFSIVFVILNCKEITIPYRRIRSLILPYGVTVTQEILVLLFRVRILVGQQNNYLIWSTLLNGLKCHHKSINELEINDNKVEFIAT